MHNDREPWNDSYELDGETERLLRKLQDGPLTDDQVRRSCLKEVDSLLTPEERTELETEMIDGAAQMLAFDLQPFSIASAHREQKREQLRSEIEWADVAPDVRDLCRRRAECILNYASENDWIEYLDGGWRITPHGRTMLERGGFNMR